MKKNVEFIRMFNYGVKPLELDNTSRLLIPKELIVFAGIKKDIVMSASGNLIEIWDKKTYEKNIKAGAVDFEKLAEEVMGNKSIGE